MVISKEGSFNYWNIWTFIKGRKKTAVTIVGYMLGYLITDSAVVGTVAAAVVEGGFALGEYYFKRVKVE